MKFLDWRRIRELGELQILTRASYFMLVLVPLLAALWRSVRLLVNQYNEAITNATIILDNTSDKLAAQAERVERLHGSLDDRRREEIIVTTRNILRNLANQIDNLISDYSLKTIKNINLPEVWALAFIASLLVLVAHLIYQTSAPEIVQKNTLQQFGIDRKNNYAENPSDGFLNRARDYLDEATNRFRYRFKVDPNPPIDSESKRRWELDVVENGGYAEYLINASRKPVAAVISGIFYLIGILIILYIVATQTYSVVVAVGWINT